MEPGSVQGPPGGALGLEESYRLALKRSETVAIQGAAVTQLEERYRQALGAVFPTLNAVGSFFTQDPGAVTFGGQTTQSIFKVTASQPLFRGFREFAGIRGSEDLVLAQIESRRLAEQQLYVDVAQNFFTVRALERDLDLVRNELKQYDRRIQELRERMRIGRSRLSEVLSTQSAQSALQAQSRQIEGQLKAAREAYWFLTGMSAETPLREGAEAIPTAAPEIGTLLTFIDERPEVRSEKARVSAAEENVRVADGAHLPSLDFNGNWYPYKSGLGNTALWDVQLLATLPLYAGGTISSRARESRAALAQEDFTLSRARRTAEEEIRSLDDTLSADIAQVEELGRATDLSDRNLVEENKDYRLGLVTNIEVLQALTSALESHRALERARYTLKLDQERLGVATARKPAILSPRASSAK